jgi:hypothetical protein
MSDGGKGSKLRRLSVSQETFANNYDNIFRKPSLKELEDEQAEQEEFDRIIEEIRIKQQNNNAG